MNGFSSRHFMIIMFTTCIVSLKTYPTIYIKDGGRDSWIAMLIASTIFLLFFIKIITTCKKNNSYNLIEIYSTVLGKKTGKFFIYLFLITLVTTLIECASVEAHSMRTNMMNTTPIWYLILFFIIPCIYVVYQDIVAIIILSIILILPIFFSGINLSILTAKYKHINYLFPVFENGINMSFFICIIKMLGLYGCLAISLPYLTKIYDTKKIIKHTFIGLLVIIQMQILSVSGLIMTFPVKLLLSNSYPKLIQTQLVSYHRFLEFGELYVLFQLLGGWLLKYIVTFYAFLILLKHLSLKGKSLKLSIFITSFIIFISAYLISNDIFTLFKFLNFYSYICLINFFIIPLFVFIRYSQIVKSDK